MDDFEPGAPSLEVSVTPGTAPAKASVTFVTCDCSSFSVPTTLAEPVNADFFAVPKATTITSSSISVSDFITTFTLDFIATSWVCIPIYEITRVFAELGTFGNVKSPSTPVIAPICVPFTNTEAPITGCPSSSEITTPVTFWVWAVTRPIPTKRQANNSINFLFINSLLKFNFTLIVSLL